MCGAEGNVDNLRKAKYVINDEVFKYFKKLSLFREMPHVLKKHYVIYSGVLRNPVVEDKKAEPYRENDVAFYNKMKQGLQIREDKNCFRFYHLHGAHIPYTMTADMKRVKAGEKVTQYDQAIGALKIVLEYIEMLKKNNLYNNTTFAILADHGKHAYLTDHSATAPLVLIKQPHAPDRPLEVRTNPISYNGLHATLLKRFGTESKRFGKDFDTLVENKRTFYIVGFRKYDIVMDEYVIQGNVEDENSWKKIRTIRNYTKSSDRSYVLGTKVSFSINGTSVKYLGKGWRRPIQNAGGICEKQAVLDFSLLNYNNKDLNLTMWASPVLYEGMTSRNLSVYVNGKKLKTWIIKKRDKYNVLIPRKLIKNNQLQIVFKLEKPTDKTRPESNAVRVYFMQMD